MIVRLSQKLSKKIKEPDLPAVPPHVNPFLDWHAHLFIQQRTQYIMVSNSKSLFSIFMLGAGVTNAATFCERMIDTLKDVLHDIGADLIFQKIIVPGMREIRLAKAQDRRVIGSMNEQIFFAKVLLERNDASPYDLTMKVNESILTIIDHASPKEAFLGMRARGE